MVGPVIEPGTLAILVRVSTTELSTVHLAELPQTSHYKIIARKVIHNKHPVMTY